MQLSVVVTIVDGGEALERCLRALQGQVDPPVLEVIIPFDDSVRQMEEVAARYSEFHFLNLGNLGTARAQESASGQHELFDRRRAAGLAHAQGDLVAMLEDRGVPVPTWANRFVAAHRQDHLVIGGAIENGTDRVLSWAVYFCDFGRFQLPFEGGAADYVSDINVCYKPGALERTRELWRERFHETTVHWALQRSGVILYLTPDVVIEQIRDLPGFRQLLEERLAWGRLFAYTRGKECTLARRLAWTTVTPLLPFILFLRLIRLRIRKRVAVGSFVKALPAILVLLTAWSVGEMVGYLTGEP